MTYLRYYGYKGIDAIAVGSFRVGIASLISSFLLIGGISSILGIIYSISALLNKKCKEKQYARKGLVLNIIAFIISLAIIIFIFCVKKEEIL